MRTFFLAFVGVLLVAGAVAYFVNPTACARLVADIEADISSLFAPAPAPEVAGAPPPKPPWAPPRSIPAQANWTWTTPHGTYKNVRIVRVDADCVTILHDDGGALVPIGDLPSPIQDLLNYDPDAARVAAFQRAKDDQASVQVLEKERADAPDAFDEAMTDYPTALVEAKTTGKRVLLHFTGSDWCPNCKTLETEVIGTSAFREFSAAHFIFVTLDYPHGFALPDNLKKQNDDLAAKFGIAGYPTLMVIDPNEKVLGSTVGYAPGSGPGAVIAELRPYAR